MAALGNSWHKFNPDEDDWKSYVERLDQYFAANDITEAAKKRATLLSSVGAVTYKLIRNLTTPDGPTSRTYKDITKLVQEHYNPKPSTIVERFKFNSRNQQSGESISNYVANLRQMTEFCDFGISLEDMLRDRLVCGIHDIRIQRRLLAEPNLTFKKAMELAIALETIDRDTKDLQDQNSQSTVNYQKELTIQKKPVITPSGQPNKCHRCGGAHFASECRFKEFICHSCKKRGHLARCCRTRIQRAESTNVIKEEQEFEHVQQREDSYTLFSLGKDQKNDPILVTVFLNGQIIEMQLDTGASVSIISETTYKSLWSQPPKLSPSNVKLHTYTGEAIAVLGSLEVEVVYKHQRARLPLLVAKGKGPSLIGRDWLQTLRLDWKEINAIYKSKSDLDVLLEQYSDVFGSQLGELQGIEADIQVDCQAVPKFHKPRSVPYILKDKIEKELDRLLVTDVIERVSFSKWAAPVVAVTKSDGSVRLCGDYKLTVNPVSLLDQYPLPRVEDLFAQLSGGKTFTKLDLSHAYHQLKLSPESRDLTTINTHKGLFQYKRLPFGVSSAPTGKLIPGSRPI